MATVNETINQKKEDILQTAKKYTEQATASLTGYQKKYMEPFLETSKEWSERYARPVYENGKKFVETRFDKTSQMMSEFFQKGVAIEKEIKGHSLSAIGQARKYITDSKTFDAVKTQTQSAVRLVKEQINLPRRDDIDRLTKAMETLAEKVDNLNNRTSV